MENNISGIGVAQNNHINTSLASQEERLPYLKRKKSSTLLLNLVFYFCGFLLIIITGFSYLYILTDVEGRSMQPTINASGLNTDMAYINRVKKGEHGDIIVFHNEISRKYVIKRLIAMEGDRIFIGKRGTDIIPRVYLKYSGTDEISALPEPYIAANDGMTTKTWVAFQNLSARSDLAFDSDGFLIIPEDHIFCLGDNRKVSDDSSSYGPVPTYDIVGRVDILIRQGENPTIQAALFVLRQFGLIR